MIAFFQWEQELRRLAFLRNTQSTTGQSGGELIGVYDPKLHARERATTETFKQKAGPFSCILRSHFWGRKLDPKLGPQVAQQLESCRKPDPVFGPPQLTWFAPGPACCNFFARCRVTVFWRMARYVDAKFADKEVLFLNSDETRVQEHWRASAVRSQQAAAFDEQPFQFPGL